MEVEEHAGHGTEHRYNAQLPYKERIPAERERLLGEIKDSLAKFTVDGDFKLLLQACSGGESCRLHTPYIITGRTRTAATRFSADILDLENSKPS